MVKKAIKKTPLDELEKKKRDKKLRKAFTLIELLAVIIILGILMIIAVPSVTKYINESRKNAYITSAKSAIDGARLLVHSGDLTLTDKDTTYYIPADYIKTEKPLKSPYGDFTEAYVGITVNDEGYNYYWISNDSSEQGISDIIRQDKLSPDLVEAGLDDTDIRQKIETTGIDGRSIIKILRTNGIWENNRIAEDDTNGEGNMYYLYYTDDSTIYLGYTVTQRNGEYVFIGNNSIEKTPEHVFDNYQDALVDRTYWKNPSKPYNFFVRFRVVNNVIDRIDLGYSLNNNLYYLKAYDPSVYQNNSSTLLASFGTDKCEIDDICFTSDGVDYGCTRCTIPATQTDPGMYIDVSETGQIDAFDGNMGDFAWSCNLGPDWTWCTVPF